MQSTPIINLIAQMGTDPQVSMDDIDQFVNECMDFLLQNQEDEDFSLEIYALEEARQMAIKCKLK